MKNVLAFDRATVRKKDIDGKLHIAISHITKADVNPYFGYEIPNYEELGLQKDNVYNLLRDPQELEKASHTFNKLPILSKHVSVFVGDTDKEFKPFIIGFSGDDAVFNAPYIDNSLVVFDGVAIAAIENKVQKEISCGYRYTPVMQSGEYNGVKYDGVMTDIIGNHIAIVELGRAGSDVVVGDSNPFNEVDMKLKKLTEAVAAKLATDSKTVPDDLEHIIKIALDECKDEDMAKDDGKLEDETDEEYKARVAKDEEYEETNKDEEKSDKDDKVTKTAMDSAINAAVAAQAKKFADLRQAEREVRPVIGEVIAQDSAYAVYKLALDHLKADVSGVDKSCYRSLFNAISKNQGNGKKTTLASDSANIDTMGNLQKFIKGEK